MMTYKAKSPWSAARALKAALAAAVLFAFVFLPGQGACRERSISVAAASDLAYAVTEAAAEFEKKTGVKVSLSLGSTGMFSRQIEQGAPFDAFFAADRAYIDGLSRGGHTVKGSERVYALGGISLAVNAASGARARTLEDLLKPEIRRVAIANPEHAPYGRAAMEALKAKGLWERLRPKIVYGENIRQALQFVQTGNATAGIVAQSLSNSSGINAFPIDRSLYGPITQSAAVAARASEREAALEFVEFMCGPQGRAILEKYGFAVPGAR